MKHVMLGLNKVKSYILYVYILDYCYSSAQNGMSCFVVPFCRLGKDLIFFINEKTKPVFMHKISSYFLNDTALDEMAYRLISSSHQMFGRLPHTKIWLRDSKIGTLAITVISCLYADLLTFLSLLLILDSPLPISSPVFPPVAKFFLCL